MCKIAVVPRKRRRKFLRWETIGEARCCDAWMAERTHYWTERRSSLWVSLCLCLYLSVSFSWCRSISLFPFSVSLSLSLSLSLFLSISLAPLSVYLSVCLSVCMSICLSVYRPFYLSICLRVYLSKISLLLFVAPHCHALMWVFHKIAVFHAEAEHRPKELRFVATHLFH